MDKFTSNHDTVPALRSLPLEATVFLSNEKVNSWQSKKSTDNRKQAAAIMEKVNGWPSKKSPVVMPEVRFPGFV